jgi:hypothetical protein
VTGLRANAVGVVPVAFQSVANMAPAAAVAFSLLFAAPSAGGSTPLSIVVGLAVLGYFLVRDRARLAQTRELFTEAVGGGHEQARDAGTRQR